MSSKVAPEELPTPRVERPCSARRRIGAKFSLGIYVNTLIQVYLAIHSAIGLSLDPVSPTLFLSSLQKCRYNVPFLPSSQNVRFHLGILLKCSWPTLIFQILMSVWLQVLVRVSSVWILLDLTSVFPAQKDSGAGMDSALVGTTCYPSLDAFEIMPIDLFRKISVNLDFSKKSCEKKARKKERLWRIPTNCYLKCDKVPKPNTVVSTRGTERRSLEKRIGIRRSYHRQQN